MSINIHTHTCYSKLDGSIRIDKYIKRIKELGQSACGITDHGSMSGVVEFYTECIKNNIKPIIGCEFYINGGNHIILFAKNQQGYTNLLTLHFESNKLHNIHNGKPNITTELLKKYSNGVICTTACAGGEVSKHGEKKLLEYKDIFGADLYVALHTNSMPNQKKINHELLNLSKKHSIKTCIEVDAHYIKKEDSYAHEYLLAMQTQKKITDEKRFRFDCNDYYLMSEEEAIEALKAQQIAPSDVMEAIQGNNDIINKCNVDIFYNKLPVVHFDNMTTEEEEICIRKELNDWFKTYCKDFDKEKKKIYIDRINNELELITSQGFTGYFLIVQDYIRYFESLEVDTYGVKVPLMNGSGRGSAGGSLVCFALGITKIDPIIYGLFFERFINPTRVGLADIDTDFDYEYRHLGIEYVRQKYGHVAQVSAFGRKTAKENVRSVLSTSGLDQKEVNRICKLISSGLSLEENLEQPEVKMAMRNRKREQSVMLALDNIVRTESTHASGVVISDKDISKIVPVCTRKDTETKERSDMPVIAFDKYTIQDWNLIKHDFLGLKTLTVLRKTLARIKKKTGNYIDIWKLPKDDSKVYETLCKGDLLGLFQFEGDSCSPIIRDIQPSKFEHIIAVEAICRPGVKDDKMYIENAKNNTRPKVHPLVDNVLDETYGAIVFQEQNMMLINNLTGGLWSLGKADYLRKVKNKDDYKEDFMDCVLKASVIPIEIAEEIWDRLDYAYSFNKSHATAYAYITYATAWLLTYYPQEFLCEIMTMNKDDKDYISKCIWNLKQHDISIFPPNINAKHTDFDCIDNGIQYGLSGINGVGDKAIEEIFNINGNISSFKEFFDKANKRVLNKKAMESLIMCGCFDFSSDRINTLREYYDLRKEKFPEKFTIQLSLYDKSKIYSTWEKDCLGFFITNNPLEKFNTLPLDKQGNTVIIYGIINTKKQITTKSNSQMCFLDLETQHGIINCTVFPKTYATYHNMLVEGKLIGVKGTKDPKDSTKILIDKIKSV